jgi:hypothetical protein
MYFYATRPKYLIVYLVILDDLDTEALLYLPALELKLGDRLIE